MTFIFWLNFFIFVILTLISVAFITLFERKVLGYSQIRVGPNKTGVNGILQPLSDAIKLYTKEVNWPYLSNTLPFFFSPCLSLSLSFMIWISLPYFSSVMFMEMSFMFFLAVLGMGVYPILVSGWSSNSNYSSLGGMRALAQTISYEVSLVFIIISMMFLTSNLNFLKLMNSQKFAPMILFFMVTLMWLISSLAELNRTPFDFAEGESELVSGFNTEYSSGSFAIIFMAEYTMIMFFSVMSSVMFMGTLKMSMLFLLSLMNFMFFYIWARSTLPRYRYDKLMYMCWKLILPISMFNIFFMVFLFNTLSMFM
uniref:NADH-ubiquinone oxidoreductase chain 1 n=1 Tax=Pseudodendrothrips mori TaxID=1291231 RepID=A0A7M3T295_9NEOP|nr:NADH dehydrogenase subunit 1 [Pseudodendrothrips mori]QFO91089.1 NADH dehydrogenase subunit 1 [Pseudodendrothrips mori]